MTTNKKVANKQEGNVVQFDASIFEADAGKGLENIGQEDLALPFLKILSGLDPILDEFEEARKGDIFNTVTNAIYKGKEGILAVPCAYQRRFIEWAPRGSGTGAPLNIFTPSDDRPRTERSSEDNREYVVDSDGSYLEETHQHLMGANGPFTPPRFSHVYRLKTVSEENSKGSWHGWDINLEGAVEDMQQYGLAKAFSESILQGEVNVKHRQEGAEKDDKAPF